MQQFARIRTKDSIVPVVLKDGNHLDLVDREQHVAGVALLLDLTVQLGPEVERLDVLLVVEASGGDLPHAVDRPEVGEVAGGRAQPAGAHRVENADGDCARRDVRSEGAKILAYLSTHMTLLPGDLPATGTSPGVGFGKNRIMSPGNVLECDVAQLGAQQHEIRERLTDEHGFARSGRDRAPQRAQHDRASAIARLAAWGRVPTGSSL
jgi:Fumarylacetoacetate (FAA) hydrolase family